MKKFFTKGLVALLPLLLTFAVVYLVISFIYSYIGVPVGTFLKWLVPKITGLTQDRLVEIGFWKWFYEAGAPIIGFGLGVILTFFIGILVATFLGKKIYQLFEKLLVKLPIFRQIYPYAKQFTGFLISDENKIEFKSVVLVPFPSNGVWSIGLITGDGLRCLNDMTKKRCLCVFVPTSPTPFSGFVVYVPQEDVLPVPISVEEAMRVIISCGILSPAHQRVDPIALQESNTESK